MSNLKCLVSPHSCAYMLKGDSWADPEYSVGVPDLFSIKLFHRGLYEPFSRINWTQGSNCFSKEAGTNNPKKFIATCDFPGGLGPDPLSPLWICACHLMQICLFVWFDSLRPINYLSVI